MWSFWFYLGFALTQPDAAAAEAPPPPSPSDDPLPAAPMQGAEAFRLVEHEANTIDNLQRAIGLYDEALKDSKLSSAQQVAMLVDQSRAWLRLGDLRRETARKIAAYENGRAAAKRAQTLDPRCADAVFWETANLANTGQARGIMSSLFMVPDIKAGFEKALALDPNHAYARDTLAKVLFVVPGIAGGDSDRAEKLWQQNLQQHPRFTPSMVEYGRYLKAEGRKQEAKSMFERVLQEKNPEPASDWAKFNRQDAKTELSSGMD